MIKSESKQNSTNVLERLRIMSESITEKQVLELFENSAYQIYSDHFVGYAQNLVKIKEIEQTGDNGLELLHTLSKMYKMNSFDTLEIKELLKTGVGIDVPDWMKSAESIRKARKISQLKQLKASMNKTYSDYHEIVCDFKSLFNLNDSDTATLRFKESLKNKPYYASARYFLHHKNGSIYNLLDKLTPNKSFMQKSIPIYFSLITGNLSRVDDGNSFIVTELDLKVSDGTMNSLMSALNKKDSNPAEVVKKIISSGLKRKYLHLSKNKASFDGFKKGRFPFSLITDEEIRNNLQYRGVYDLKEIRKMVPKPELERYDSILDGLLGR